MHKKQVDLIKEKKERSKKIYSDIALLKTLNENEKDYDCKLDKRIHYLGGTNNIKNSSDYTLHHIIPSNYELIPNLIIKWTIQFLKNNNEEVPEIGFRIRGKKLVISSKKKSGLYLTRKTHTRLHNFLDLQCKALYCYYNISFSLHSFIFSLPKKYLYLYAGKKQQNFLQQYNIEYIEKNDIKLKKVLRGEKIKENDKQVQIVNISGTDLFLEKKEKEKNYKLKYKDKNTKKHFYKISHKVKDYRNMDFPSICNYIKKLDLEDNLLGIIRKAFLKNIGINNIKASSKLQNGHKVILNDYQNLISKNIYNIAKYEGIEKIFNIGYTRLIEKNKVGIEYDTNKIVNGIETIAYLYFSGKMTTEFHIKYVQ